MKRTIPCALIALSAAACASQKPEVASWVPPTKPCHAAKRSELPPGTTSIAPTVFAIFRTFAYDGRTVIYSRHIDEENRVWLAIEGYEVPGTRDDCNEWVKIERIPSENLGKVKAA